MLNVKIDDSFATKGREVALQDTAAMSIMITAEALLEALSVAQQSATGTVIERPVAEALELRMEKTDETLALELINTATIEVLYSRAFKVMKCACKSVMAKLSQLNRPHVQLTHGDVYQGQSPINDAPLPQPVSYWQESPLFSKFERTETVGATAIKVAVMPVVVSDLKVEGWRYTLELNGTLMGREDPDEINAKRSAIIWLKQMMGDVRNVL